MEQAITSTISATTTLDQASGRIWDAIVIGAGPTGAMAAYRLAQNGHSVLLVDKSAFPREKVCGCCLSAAAIQTLQQAGIKLPPVSSNLSKMQLSAEGRTASFPLPAGKVISRSLLDAHLIETAIAAGADFLPKTIAPETIARNDSRIITLTSGSKQIDAKAKILLVAEGINGQLLRGDRSLKIHPDARFGVATTVQCASDAYAPHVVHMACAKTGYVGLVRFGDSSLHIAVAIDPAETRQIGVGPAVEAILRNAGLPPIEYLKNATWQGTAPLTRMLGKIAAHRLFVLGDAAGYVEPFTGEGIAWALASGHAIAPLASAAIHHWSDRLIQDWTILQNRLIRRRQLICHLTARALRHPRLISTAICALRLMPGLTSPVTGILNLPYRTDHLTVG